MATLTPETGDYLGISGGGGYTTPPTTSPIPGSPGGTTPWYGTNPVLKPTSSGAPSCGGRCGGSGPVTVPPVGGGGNVPAGGGGGTPLIPYAGTSALRATTETVREEAMPRNWLWLAVAAGVGYWLGKQK